MHPAINPQGTTGHQAPTRLFGELHQSLHRGPVPGERRATPHHRKARALGQSALQLKASLTPGKAEIFGGYPNNGLGIHACMYRSQPIGTAPKNA